MSLRTPEQYLKALRAEGLTVVTHSGWRTVNRPGPWNPHGIITHHTGPYRSVTQIVGVLRSGYGDLPGPLAHAAAAPNGTIHQVGWFDANHAGMGDPAVLRAVIEDRPAPEPRAPSSVYDTEDGNDDFYGLELIHPGDETPWPAEQVEAAVRYNAAVCRLHGWGVNSAIYHKGWTVRKQDPHGFLSLPEFHDRMHERLQHAPGWNPPEDDMPYTEAQMIDFVRRGVQAELGDENKGVFSDRVAHKVIAALPPSAATAASAAALAHAVTTAFETLPDKVAEKVLASLPADKATDAQAIALAVKDAVAAALSEGAG